MPEKTAEQKEAINSAMVALIESAKLGIKPSEEQIHDLLVAWGIETEGILRGTVRDNVEKTIQTKPAKPWVDPKYQAIIESGRLEETTNRAIEDALKENFGARGRGWGSIFRTIGLPLNLEVGEIVKQSVEKSLKQHDDLHTLALKQTILQDFPKEVGGGGSDLIHPLELRKLTIERLIDELDRMTGDPFQNEDFDYLFYRVAFSYMDLCEARLENLGLHQFPKGIQRTKATLQLELKNVQDWIAEQSKR